jgi:hypothetical protein
MKRRGFFKLLSQGAAALGLTTVAKANPFVAPTLEPEVKEVTKIPRASKAVVVATSAGGAGGGVHEIILTGTHYCGFGPDHPFHGR